MTLLWSQLSSIISAVLYQNYYVLVDGDVRRGKINPALMYSVVLGLAMIWVFASGSFLKRINPKYIRTFVDTRTGSQYLIDLFRSGDDATKSTIFKKNKRLWFSIRGEVMTWTRTNWANWIETKPAWFTSNFIAMVPDEVIPVELDPLRQRSSGFLLEDFVGFIGLDRKGWGEESGGRGMGGVVGEKSANKRWKKSSSKVADAPDALLAVNVYVNAQTTEKK